MADQTQTTPSHPRHVWIRTIAGVFVIVAGAGIVAYLIIAQSNVYTDKASISAPIIELSPQGSGTLQEVFVQEGDTVSANETVARVGNELVKTKIAGVVVGVPDKIGAAVAPGEPVVDMIDPSALRVVGNIDEDKGLSSVAVGDSVTFTVDAFGGKEFQGVVDEVAPTSNQSGVVFNISDQREVKQFAVKVRFDVAAHPEIKNGMSARMWIYTK
ncbi:MAG TPA: efflux RND transporter periplasmic adaptor subunit [Candidatus Paceibacterota bacterium]